MQEPQSRALGWRFWAVALILAGMATIIGLQHVALVNHKNELDSTAAELRSEMAEAADRGDVEARYEIANTQQLWVSAICSIRVYEDGSAVFEDDDFERTECTESAYALSHPEWLAR